ncbi:MAG: hypothetical protein JWO07_499 [Candidatus Saccharibacteria bacterium]|nr:hypothetical protein [Candidatus Saccharibacteria bacterium]
MGKPISPAAPPPVSLAGSQNQDNSVVDENGQKIIPRIEIKSLQSRIQGDQLIVTAWVVNDSDQRVRIDTCHLLGQKRQFNQDLNPHQSHQLTFYQGPAPHDENEHHADIIYRLHGNGDSFQSSYRIDYHLEHDGKRSINSLQDEGPTRDI